MKHATFRFYAELRDFLPPDRAPSGTVVRAFHVGGSVKDMLEGCGVPHTEVELVVVNGRSVDFGFRVSDGDRVAVYPVFESFDVSSLVRVRPEPLRDTRFVLDAHLGRLARFLRLLGFDTVYDADLDDPDLVGCSAREGRILLTRDVELLKHGALTHGSFVRSTEPEEQLLEVVRRFHLSGGVRPYTRCMVCNAPLADVAVDEVIDLVPPRTAHHAEVFRRCTGCGKVYWRGAHTDRLDGLVAEARGA